MENENVKTKHDPKTLNKVLVNWAKKLQDHSIKDGIAALDELNYAYLCSDMANIKSDRRNVVFHQDLIRRFLKDISKFSDIAFDKP